MNFDGAVAKIYDNDEDNIFLFLIDPKSNKLQNGINISDSSNIYEDLKYNEIQIVDVILKDGTEDVGIDLEKFVSGGYGQYDIFIHIKDIMRFTLQDDETSKNRSIKSIIDDKDFVKVVKECIIVSKDPKIIKENKERYV